MKRPITSVIALSLIGVAAFTAQAGATPASDEGGAVITFARASASTPASGRVWYVVGRDALGSGQDDTPPAGWDPSVPAEDDDPNYAGNDQWVDDGYDLPASLPDSEYGRLQILQAAGLASGGSYEAALQQLELAFMFAGREQWVRNVSGVGVEDEPALWDVSMESVRSEPNAERLLLGRTIAVEEERGLQAVHDDLSYWESLVPAWAPRVRDELAARGIPFSVELLASPELNLTDPSKPLFPKNTTPTSLFQVGVLQRGERAYLRSLTAEELMLQVWPAYWRYYHRPAGAPVPDDLRAGLTFGSPVRLDDGTYLRSPLMSSDSYLRWLAYGYPGDRVDPKAGGLLDGIDGFGVTARFSGAWEKYAPWNLDEATITRYETLLAGN